MGNTLNLICPFLALLLSKVFDIMERGVSGLNSRELLCSCGCASNYFSDACLAVNRRQSVLAKEVDPYAGSSIFDILSSRFAFAGG